MDKKELFKYVITEFHETPVLDVKKRFLKMAETDKVISLIGSRRSGKTYYFYQIINEIRKNIDISQIMYINFEDERILPLKAEEMNSIIEAYFELYPENIEMDIYLFFDEIQNIDGWELFIRRLHDKKKFKIFVTGSSSKLLSKEIATSLRGRTITYNMYPLDFNEFLDFKGIKITKNIEYEKIRYKVLKMFETYLYDGGFPEVAIEKEELRQKILINYFEMFIYKDLVERYAIRNITLLKKLAQFLITNIGSGFSVNTYYNTIKKEMAVGKETLMEYISYLEDIGLIYLIPIFSHSLKKQQVNPRKIYCIDNGLRNAVAFKFSKDEGRLAENLVFTELIRREKEPYYWKGKGEVDFVMKNKDGSLDAINVSYTNEIEYRETSALKELKNNFGDTVNEMILLTKDIEKVEDNIKFIPLWKWMLHL